MNRRILSWSITALAATVVVLGGCRKVPNPFEPIVGMHLDAALVDGKLRVTGASGNVAIAGIRTGDVILAVNGRSVATARELNDAVQRSGRLTALLIERGNARIDVPIPNESTRD